MNINLNPPQAQVLALLEASGLPTSDIKNGSLQHFMGCTDSGHLCGVIGLELYGECGLLRSLAVAPTYRGKGYGKALVMEAERYAHANKLQQLYLLTTTAEQFFLQLGYANAIRESAPASIRQTPEFSSLCPASSALMCKSL